ncbi:MAG TPA: DUF4920 domain-containing protein [Aquaticitalea sp.]|nr:DUF4920 domain-containing protein [Aquaticitalea sp.]HNU58762.1 DUF4920 domain-containing protein [Aquaticitalea sp.]
MKNLFLYMFAALMLVSCKQEAKETTADVQETVEKEIAYASFGQKIDAVNVLATNEMHEKYKGLKPGDTFNIKMGGTVKEVCQVKGCWMTVDLGDGEEAVVRFKDYEFFVPKNISGKEVVVNGSAYVKELSVAELRHRAEDGGKSEEEISAITEPQKTYVFMADGVLVEED